MLLILASRTDQAAVVLAEQWGAAGARLLTPRDLSRAGWRLHSDSPEHDRFVLPADRPAPAAKQAEPKLIPEPPTGDPTALCDLGAGEAGSGKLEEQGRKLSGGEDPEDDPSPDDAQPALSGHVLSTRLIRGVLVRLPAVTPDELPHIHPADRAYVAAEMQALLVFWLATLPCPVLNRPSTTCLAGPGWTLHRWTALAASLGIPTPTLRFGTRTPEPHGGASGAVKTPTEPPPDDSDATVTVLGERCFGGCPAHHAAALALARAAGTPLLEVLFTGDLFTGVHLIPSLHHEALSAATLRLLQQAALPEQGTP